MKKIVLLMLILGCPYFGFSIIYASGPPEIPGFNPDVDRPLRSFFLNTQFANAGFTNSAASKLSYLEMEYLQGFSFEIGYEKRLQSTSRENPLISNQWRRFMTVGIGVGYRQHGSLFTSEHFQVSAIHPDISGTQTIQENQSLPTQIQWDISYESFREELTASFLHIPAYFEIGDINPNRLGFFLRFGLDLAIPLDHNFQGNGIYTVVVTESVINNPDESWELTDIYELGYLSNALLHDRRDDYVLSDLQLSGFIAGGISTPIPVNSLYGLVFCLGVQYSYGITNAIMSSEVYSETAITNTPAYDIKMILDNGKSTHLQRLGFQIGLKYSLSFN